MPPHDKAAELNYIEEIERGDADGDALTAAWRATKTLQLNLRTRMRRAVARSTALPPKLAAEVIQRFPEDLFANPALALLLLDTPDLLQRAPRRFWDAVLAAPELSPALFPALVAGCPHPRLGHLARRPEFEPADAPAMLRRLQRDSYAPEPDDFGLTEAQCLALCQQWHEPMLDLDPETLAALRSRRGDMTARAMLMRARQLSLDEAMALIPPSVSRQYPESLALAGREDLTDALREELLTCDASWVRAQVCANPSTPAETLVRFVTDRNPFVSAAALLNPRLPREGYARVLTRGTAVRRTSLAARPDLLAEDFALLAQSGEAQVRTAVAQNPHAPAEVIARLGQDLIDEVREAAAANPRYVPEVVAAQADPSPPSKTGRRAKAPRPTVLDAARKLLVGDTSGGVKWEPSLQWVANGGPRPERVTMTAQDRRKVLRAAQKVLGEDLTADPTRERLLVVLIDGLGCLPELSLGIYGRIPFGTAEERARLAAQWMTLLQRAGFSEAQALALLCYTRTTARLGRSTGMAQRQLATAALSERGDRALALLHALPKGKAREHFAEDLAELTSAAAATPEARVRWLVALYVDPVARAAMEPEGLRRLAREGNVAFVRALETHDAALAQTFLKRLDLGKPWMIPPDVVNLARAAQGLK